MAQVPPLGSGPADYPNPHQDVPSWWSIFFGRGWKWRWFGNPHLYFRPNLEYVPGPTRFTVIDGLGREKTYDKSFDCYLDPFNGKIETLYVQAPESLCRLSATRPNATWKRTPIRNATPLLLRLANLPFRFVPVERRGDISQYNAADWMIVVAMWIPTLVIFLFYWVGMWMVGPDQQPEGKDPTKYLPMLYRGLRYPRLARNMLENREQVVQQLQNHATWNTKAALSTYRTFRPRFLNYLVEVERDGRKRYQYERRPVGPNDLTPFVLVAFSSEHYHIPDEDDPRSGGGGNVNRREDLEALLAVGTKAAETYFSPLPADLQKTPRAFWLSANCMPAGEVADEYGNVRRVDGPEKEALANQDTYSISDIIRAARHVIVVAGNVRRPWDDQALQVWGQRVWTLPEIVLSKGDSVTVWRCGSRPKPLPPVETEEIPKALFPSMAWQDSLNSRQLIEHYSNLHLSRLELVKIALDCLMSRKFRALHPGDRVYVLMGLLRIRPPIDKTDSAFQAFARLSLPQDSDRLMERLVCLLPDTPEQNWELMTDQYQASLWDIYPDTQVCGIGENDTVIVDGAKGAQVQWSMFTEVRALRKLTLKRQTFLFLLIWSPLLLSIGIILTGISAPRQVSVSSGYDRYGDEYTSTYSTPSGPAYDAGVAITVITLVLFILPAPYFLSSLYAGKLWAVEPCFFGIEGYVPIELIEERLFGKRSRMQHRLRWSAWGSPLSRHKEGQPMHERAVKYKYRENNHNNNAHAPELDSVTILPTYPIETIDPTTPCSSCSTGNPQGGMPSLYCPHHPTVASLQDMSLRSAMGQLKPFTLVDTFNMTVTLFYAVRPPTVLVVGGSEGGMKRAIACSFDVATGTLYRETVLRIPSQSVDCMERLPRIRLGLRRAFLEGDGVEVGGAGGVQPQQQQQQGAVGNDWVQYNQGMVPVQYTHEPKR
ncbi:hypothetical protein C8A03DRAFT_47424 [Achaetomium macrosporum]|uniref:Uncharacterized protein n=1 Tax=Achaetomium macrosporum TaxID=79813 RepID=A0AAN7HAL2_9PEZI|nr:hypothetical protein C8A03DRAFT_47424 [Achaetomium macrosporum]